MLEGINPNALLIGFGRRFATYKRAHLLFTDLERLERIVNNPKYPVQFLFTGKAHPADGGGQGLIKYILEISRRPEFLGKIIFLENYDMRLASKLIAGVDIYGDKDRGTDPPFPKLSDRVAEEGMVGDDILACTAR